MTDHEEKIVRSFIIKEKRDRYLMLLRSNKKRNEALNRLNHCRDLDERFIEWLPSNADIAKISKEEGSPDQVYVISDSKNIDSKMMTLSDAIHETSMNGSGTIVSCIPGKLAYYYDEVGDRRGILKRNIS
jgi:hypothetical protein